MEQIYLPTLHTFAMGNEFSGSKGLFRFMIKPNVVMLTQKEVDFAQSSIQAEFWHGKFCYDLCQKEGCATFPMTEEGRLAMMKWLEDNV